MSRGSVPEALEPCDVARWAPQIAVPWVGLIRPRTRTQRDMPTAPGMAPGRETTGRPLRGCAFISERKVAGLGHTDVQRGIRRWPKAHRSELNSGAQGCLAGHPPALASRPFVRAALPSSRAAGPRAPGAALLGSSCAGNPSSWAWAAILSSCHALASSTPVSRPLETLGARWVNWLSLAIAQQRQSVTAPPSSCRAVSRATRPQARGARARPRVATPHPFRNAPLWRCRVVLYSSTKLPGTDRPATIDHACIGGRL